MKEKQKYLFKAQYKSDLGICSFEVFRDYDHILTSEEEKEELYKLNSLLKEKHNAEKIIFSTFNKQGLDSEKAKMSGIVQIDLNKLKSYNLKDTLVEQLISVIDEINEFEVVTDFDEETDLIDRDELLRNRKEIIKSGLKTISELYKFFVKLGFSNEEINEWISEVNGN